MIPLGTLMESMPSSIAIIQFLNLSNSSHP
jgi:hypothetical protein